MVRRKSLTIIIVSSILCGVSTVIICLRCYVRLRIVKLFGWDDGLMVAAMIMLVAYTTTTIGGAVCGTGRKMGDLTSQELNLRLARLFWWLGQDFYVTACVLTKASICACLWRITINQVHRMFLCLVMAFSILAGLVFFFFTTFQCHPVSHYWNTTIADEKCLKTAAIIKVAYAYSAVAAASDFAIGLLPVFIVWNLQMAKACKYGLIGLLGIACVASFAVIIRIPYLQAPSRSEPLYAAGNIIIWSYVEVSAGIIAGSIPTLRPLRVLPGRLPCRSRSWEFQNLTSRTSNRA